MIAAVWDGYHAESIAWLRTQKAVRLLSPGEEESLTEALLIRSQTKVNEALLKRFPNLKVVITSTSGFDHIDWKLCQNRSVVSAFCPNSNADSAAEHTLFLILNLLKNSKSQFAQIQSGQWRSGLSRGHLLKGKTVGIVGLGRIGSRVARLVNAFQAQVIAHDPYQTDAMFEELKARRLGLIEVFRESDILSLHVPYTKLTHHLITRATLSELSDHALVVNVSRGHMVEESDLVTALREDHIAGAALDVFAKEPMEASSFLLKEKRLIVTPHTGAFTEEAWLSSSMEAATKLVEFAKGSKITDTLPLDAPWFKDSLQQI